LLSSALPAKLETVGNYKIWFAEMEMLRILEDSSRTITAKNRNGAVVLGSVPKLKSKFDSSFSPNVNNAGCKQEFIERSLKSAVVWRWTT